MFGNHCSPSHSMLTKNWLDSPEQRSQSRLQLRIIRGAFKNICTLAPPFPSPPPRDSNLSGLEKGWGMGSFQSFSGNSNWKFLAEMLHVNPSLLLSLPLCNLIYPRLPSACPLCQSRHPTLWHRFDHPSIKEWLMIKRAQYQLIKCIQQALNAVRNHRFTPFVPISFMPRKFWFVATNHSSL